MVKKFINEGGLFLSLSSIAPHRYWSAYNPLLTLAYLKISAYEPDGGDVFWEGK